MLAATNLIRPFTTRGNLMKDLNITFLLGSTIATKWFGPTDHNGSRIQAKSSTGRSILMPYRYELNVDENHREAFSLLCDQLGWDKLGWNGRWFAVSTDTGYLFTPDLS